MVAITLPLPHPSVLALHKSSDARGAIVFPTSETLCIYFRVLMLEALVTMCCTN